MSIKMECEYCGNSIIAKRRSRKYCSDSCKTMASRKHNKELQEEEKQIEEENQRLDWERMAKMQKEAEDENKKIIQEITDMLSESRRNRQQKNNGKSIETRAKERSNKNDGHRSQGRSDYKSRKNRVVSSPENRPFRIRVNSDFK